MQRSLLAASILGLVSLFPGQRPARADMQQQLRRGEILAVSVPEGSDGIRAGRAVGVVDAAPDKVQRILADFGHYDEFVPMIVGARRVCPNRFRLESDLPWPVNRTWVEVKVRTGERDGVRVVQWSMVSGSLKKYEGAAWIQPMGNGRSMLTYQVVAVPDNIMAPEALVSHGLRIAAVGMVKAVRKRVTQLSDKMGAPAPDRRVARF